MLGSFLTRIFIMPSCYIRLALRPMVAFYLDWLFLFLEMEDTLMGSSFRMEPFLCFLNWSRWLI